MSARQTNTRTTTVTRTRTPKSSTQKSSDSGKTKEEIRTDALNVGVSVDD